MIDVCTQPIRLSAVEEQAVNELLLRHGGNANGKPLFHFGWAEDDNRGRKLPLCFANQKSYHLLIWEPPSWELRLSENQTGEDVSSGTYNCILHFLDEKGHAMFKNRVIANIAENVIPAINAIRNLVHSGHFGYEADRARAELRARNALAEQQEREKQEELENIAAHVKDSMPRECRDMGKGKLFDSKGNEIPTRSEANAS